LEARRDPLEQDSVEGDSVEENKPKELPEETVCLNSLANDHAFLIEGDEEQIPQGKKEEQEMDLND